VAEVRTKPGPKPGSKRPGFGRRLIGISLSGEPEIVHEPMPDELQDQLHELMERQTLRESALPRELYFRQRRLLEWQLTHPSQDQIEWLRWRAVCRALDAGYKLVDGSLYPERSAFVAAAKMIEGLPEAAGVVAIRKSFLKLQKDLPPAQRRPTSRKRHIG
jgi:hypothetical protein